MKNELICNSRACAKSARNNYFRAFNQRYERRKRFLFKDSRVCLVNLLLKALPRLKKGSFCCIISLEKKFGRYT